MGTGKCTRGGKTVERKESVELGHPEGESGPHNSRHLTNEKYQSRLAFIPYCIKSPSIPGF